MMRSFAKCYRSLSRRALSVILAIAVFLSMILAVVSGIVLVSIAGNPSTVGALNHTSTVQQINLMPVDPTPADSRTTLEAGTGGVESFKYSDITVNEDESVDFTITQDTTHNQNANNNTSFVESFTLINQRINLAENPWLMMRWSGSGRVNGRIYFTVTKDGVEHGPDNVTHGTTTDANDKTVSELSTWDQQKLLTNNTTTNKLNVFSIPLSNIINNNSAGYKYTNQTQTDFNASSVQDFTIDFYEYLNTQVKNYNDNDSTTSGISLDDAYWPSGDDWKDSSKNYITVYMSCQIIASEANHSLTAGTNVHWEQFALGREVLDRPASMLPRTAEFMNITDTTGTNGVDYGRVSASTDGSVTFSNTSDTEKVLFGWNLRRYFNATELESLHVEATFTGMDSDDFDIKTWYGGRTTSYLYEYNDSSFRSYSYRGTEQTIQWLMKNYGRSNTVTDNSLSAIIDFHQYITWDEMDDSVNYPAEYKELFPDDSLIYIGDIQLTLPAGAKITFTRLEFQVENEEIPATKADTAYPWYSNSTPDGLPPVGTPAYSTTLNGASGRSYDWVTEPEDAPIVATKVDLLAMKTYSFKKWNHGDTEYIYQSEDNEVGVPYTRYTDGSSVYSSNNQTENTYYTLMRFGPSTDYSRNYYTYLDMEETPYLYYSYELVDTALDDGNDPKAGFYFHFQNSARDKFVNASGNQAYAYQYYLDHSGIALNECSSVYSLGYSSGAYEYGSKAILSSSKERTGCIDISSLYVDGVSDADSFGANAEYLKLESIRIYLAPGTDIKINYFFVGSGSLSEEVIGTSYPTQGGEAYPWATTKEQFDAATDPDSDSAQMTFANKVDVLADLQDRVAVNGRSGFPGATVNEKTGAVTVTVTDTSNVNTGYYKEAGSGFDHLFRVQVAEDGDLSSIRYLNYSVDAPAGMRWSMVISEHNTNSTPQRAIMTWCDSDACWDDNDIYTSAPAGKSYFRMVSYNPKDTTKWENPEYNDYWVGKNNTSWRIYSIPGSQTGCIDLQQVYENFDWGNIVSIYLVAYRDPNLDLQDSEAASVTFNYVYLTSEPIATKSDVGKAAASAGTIYDWGNTEVEAPSVATDIEFLYDAVPDVTVNPETTFLDYYPYGMVDYLKFEENEIETGETHNIGEISIDANNTVTISADQEFAFSVVFGENNRPTYDLSMLNQLYTSINAEAPFRIAVLLDNGSTESWVNLTGSVFGNEVFPLYTIPTDSASYVAAGSYKSYLDFAQVFNFTDKTNVKLERFAVRFLGTTVSDTDGSARKSTLTISALQACNTTVNLTATPYLYYSYRFVDITTGKTVTQITDADGNVTATEPLRVGMSIFESEKYFYFRNTGGSDSNSSSNVGWPSGTNRGYGKPAFARLETENDTTKINTKYYYVYGSETGCINLSEYFTGDDSSAVLNRIRFYIPTSYYNSERYELKIDYLFLGSAATSSDAFTQYSMPSQPIAPTPADFQVNIVEHNTDVSAGITDLSPAIEIDLDKTPYLYYSINYAAGSTGTFGLTTDQTIDSSNTFFRDVGRTDGKLISAGSSPTQYLQQSETGCIDVRSWYHANGYTGSVLRISALELWGAGATINYMYFGAEADKTIDLIPETAAGALDNGLPTRTWIVPAAVDNYAEMKATDDEWDEYDPATSKTSTFPTANIKYKGDITDDGFNDLWLQATSWHTLYLRYGNIITKGKNNTFSYCSTGNNQMSGLTIDLNETPYLHFSFDQPADSRTTLILQLKNYTATEDLVGKTADNVKPWLSAYSPTSAAGQLIMVVSEENVISYYKDIVDDEMPSNSGSFGGVIDLRSWYTVTNGCDNVISLDSVRLYAYAANGEYSSTDLKVNHLYLSSSSSAAYSVTFHKNDNTDTSYTQYVLKNANEQYVSDEAVADYKVRDGYTFVGWYTDPECETYFDITGTPMTGNIDLYARWIQNDTIVMGDGIKEVSLLASMSSDNMTVESGSGTVEMDPEALTLTNNGSGDYTVTFPINKAYSVEALRSLFLGFDNDITCQGFDITLNAKCSTTRSYSLIQGAFAADYLTDQKLLTAAPHGGESAFYTYLGVRDDLPTRENVDGLIEVKSITVTVPADVSVELRYIKAGNEMALMGNTDVRAPLATGGSFDLLANTEDDPAFVSLNGDIVYNVLESKSYTYENDLFTQASIHSDKDGFAHIGGLYSYTIDMKNTATDNPGRYLHFSIDQAENSHFTFALYASFSGMVEGDKAGTRDVAVYDIHTPKSVSYYDASSGGFVAKSLDKDAASFIPVDTAYINGQLVGSIDLYAWYQDALVPYRSNSQVDSVEILGLRLYTDSRTTDTTINYMFIGGKEHGDSSASFGCYAEYPYMAGHGADYMNPDYIAEYEQHRHNFGVLHRGDTLYVSLDELEGIKDFAPIGDPTKVFLGWYFSDQKYWGYGDLVYWNPNAENGNEYDPVSNPYGSWSLKPYEGFVTNQKSVFYTFSTLQDHNTQVICPVFADAGYTPILTATVEGSGSVLMLSADANTAGENTWTAPYASELVLRASGDNFMGWYDQNGVLISLSKDYHVTLVTDTTVTAKFASTAEDTLLEYLPQNGRTIVWLQSEYGTAGIDFYLQSINGGSVVFEDGKTAVTVQKSNINDLNGKTQIACYWNIADAQMLKAVAPSGYHWEQLLSDGSKVRVSAGAEYTFVASTNINLVAVADGAEAFQSAVMIDEFAFDDNRDDAILRLNGQVICSENEELISCGMVFTDYKNHGEIPAIDCAASETVTATAWNSTTGQFVVEFSLENFPEYSIRGYAILRNTVTGEFVVRYSQCMATVF